MKIVVVSDTHGNRNILEKIKEQNKDASLLLHAGDSQLFREEMYPFITIKGNCDYDSRYDESFDITLSCGKLHMEHGHRLGYLRESYLQQNNYKIFIHGHTHSHYVKQLGDSYVCCPGSPNRPRDGSSGTYLIIDVNDKDIKFNFKYL